MEGRYSSRGNRKCKGPKVGTKASRKPSLAGAVWSDLRWERW